MQRDPVKEAWNEMLAEARAANDRFEAAAMVCGVIVMLAALVLLLVLK